jgi:hypothetical protein
MTGMSTADGSRKQIAMAQASVRVKPVRERRARGRPQR